MVRRLSTKRPTAGQKPTTAPSVPQIEGEGEVVPLAALRMTRAKEAHRV